MNALPTKAHLPHTSPLFWSLLCFIAGISVGERCFAVLSPIAHIHYYIYGVSALCIFLLALHLRRRKPSPLLSFLWSGLALTTLGTGLLVSDRLDATPSWPHDATTQVPTAHTYRAIVHQPPRTTAKGQRTRLRLLDTPWRNQQVEIFLMGHRDSLRVGDAIVVHTALRTPNAPPNPEEMDYDAYLRHQGVAGTGLAFQQHWRKIPTASPLTLQERALQWRDEILRQYADHFSHHHLGLLAAMTLGSKQNLEAETRQLFSQTGASHVLALSGLHLAIVYALYQYSVVALARRHSRRATRMAQALGLPLLWAFALLTGFPTSLIRAATMLSIAQVFSLFSYRASGFHCLVLAAFAMLLWQPSWLFDVGFQLSCMAVAGILWLQPLWPMPQNLRPTSPPDAPSSRHRWPVLLLRFAKAAASAVLSLFYVSLAAQLATAPLVAYYFHLLPLSGLLSNFIVVPIAHLVLIGAVAFFALPFAQSWIAPAIATLLTAMETSLRWLSSLPHAALPITLSATMVVGCYAFIIVGADFALQRHPRQRLVRWCALCLLGLGIYAVSFYNPLRIDRPTLRIDRTHGSTTLRLLAPQQPELWLTTDSLSSTATPPWAKADSLLLRPLRLLDTAEGCRSLTATTPHFGFAPRTLLIGHQRVAIVTAPLSWSYPAQPLRVDVLLIAHRGAQRLAHLLRYYRPRRLLLAADLSLAQRQRLLREAHDRQLPVSDIERTGWVELQ